MNFDYKKAIKSIKQEIRMVKHRDPAAKSSLEILLTYSGLHAVLIYRLSHKVYLSGYKTTARVISQV
ncbi:MAG: serine O-acetyltransferase, partial [Oscillospiraceae bacterium]|nr:serine O-acetyltransferase [Oscillospiraceae bacterium]